MIPIKYCKICPIQGPPLKAHKHNLSVSARIAAAAECLSEGGSDDTKLRTQMWKMCYFPSCPSAKRILKPDFSVFAFIGDSRFYFLD